MNTHKPIYRVVEHFGNITRAAQALGVKRQLFQAWMAQGFIPFKRGDQVEQKTDGAVKAIEIWEAAARGGK